MTHWETQSDADDYYDRLDAAQASRDTAADAHRDTTPKRDAIWDKAVFQAFSERLADPAVNISERALEIEAEMRGATGLLTKRQAF